MKILKNYRGFSYEEVNRFGLDGVLSDEYEKIGIHISKNVLNNKDIISMIRYCKTNNITTLITDIKHSWVKDLVIYNGLNYVQL
jgi:hypothetical protein